MLQDKIEILPVSLLETKRALVEEMRQISQELSIGLGWHYLLDLSWAALMLSLTPGMRVIDAGAGTGIMQWWLADRGVDVISLDRTSRRNLSWHFQQRYRIHGWRQEDLIPRHAVFLQSFLPPRSPRRWHRYPQQLATSWRQWRRKRKSPTGSGTVFIYNQNLTSIPDIPDNSVDAVVSISALEHNSPDELRVCVAELMRVLKPGGRLIATLAAAREQDWFHEPSKGWCYTEDMLRGIFELPTDCPSNYEQYDELFTALRGCAELRDNLSDSYFKSGDNGMPWGIWNPQYQPVGVCKVKK